MFEVHIDPTAPASATTRIRVNGSALELRTAIQVLGELGWDNELATPAKDVNQDMVQAEFLVETSMIDEFKKDVNALQEELSSNGS
ncbi:hypothetical protein [Aestuariirhabdus sp. LZHN29]|uniref:hypothetical protein n=1 Tax=Aestuariirhabdus sp. LZHN29 TaxID=3417462 RepID=UPI003CF03D5E